MIYDDVKAAQRPPPMLRAIDRCDRCGAQAYVKVYLPAGTLLFCGHHYAKHEIALMADGAEVLDERWALNISNNQGMAAGKEASLHPWGKQR